MGESDKAKTNKRWTSSEAYREHYDNIFKKVKYNPVKIEGNTYYFSEEAHASVYFKKETPCSLILNGLYYVKIESEIDKSVNRIDKLLTELTE